MHLQAKCSKQGGRYCRNSLQNEQDVIAAYANELEKLNEELECNWLQLREA